MRKETRSLSKLDRRALSDAEKSAGYIGAVCGVIPYNSDSGELRDHGLNGGRPFREQIAPDAFKRSVAEDGDIMGFVGHTDDPLCAFARAGSNLTFTDSPDGLKWEALAPDTAACRDLMRLVDTGVIKGTSFEFAVRSATGEKWEKRDGTDLRTITDARLYAVNPVAWPAYDDGALTVSMRALAAAQEAIEERAAEKAAAEKKAREDAETAERAAKESALSASVAANAERERRFRVLSLSPANRS